MGSRVSAQTPPLPPSPYFAALSCERIETDTPPLPPSICSQFAVKVSGLRPRPPHPPSACEPPHHSEQSQRAQALLLKQKNSSLAIASFRDIQVLVQVCDQKFANETHIVRRPQSATASRQVCFRFYELLPLADFSSNSEERGDRNPGRPLLLGMPFGSWIAHAGCST